MNAATMLLLHQVTMNAKRPPGSGTAGKATIVGAAGTDPDDNLLFFVIGVLTVVTILGIITVFAKH